MTFFEDSEREVMACFVGKELWNWFDRIEVDEGKSRGFEVVSKLKNSEQRSRFKCLDDPRRFNF